MLFMSHAELKLVRRSGRVGIAAHLLTLTVVGAIATLAHSRGGGVAASMTWHTVDGGGGTSTAGLTSLDGTFGQADATSAMTGGDWEFVGGFWSGVAPSAADTCPADLDGDGVVGAADLATLLGAWSTTSASADLDGSGHVDAGDLAVLLGGWGSCDP